MLLSSSRAAVRLHIFLSGLTDMSLLALVERRAAARRATSASSSLLFVGVWVFCVLVGTAIIHEMSRQACSMLLSGS